MERCPNCRARYREGQECPRCGMDLSQLLALEAEAERWEGHAVKLLLSGEFDHAVMAAEQATALQQRPLAALLPDFVTWCHRQ